MSTMEFDLATLPAGIALSGVTASTACVAGRQALRVALREDVARDGRPHVDYIDMRTFAALPVAFTNGRLSVDILSRLLPDAPEYARAFAGLAYRITANTFESVYLRPCNGLKTQAPPPRNARAVQYFAYPQWRYERLRQDYPDGRYEAAADIAPNEWVHLTLEVNGTGLRVQVNGHPVLESFDTKLEPASGCVGLFVDIGTEAYFANLSVDTR